MNSLAEMTPSQVRKMIRRNELVRPTAGMASGYTQANLAILKKGCF